MRTRLAGALALASIVGLLVPSSSTAEVVGTDVTYTSDADFDAGTLVSVNHDTPFNDQLQLDSPTEPFPFINVAASGRGTVVRVNTDTGEIVGEYRTAPEDRGLDPSRTTVDLFGNVWTANRGEVGEIDGVPHGSAVKIGLIVGGTSVDATGAPDPTGGYLAPPFGYSTCVDRNGDGLIRTSNGLLDVLDWPDDTDGVGGSDGAVEDAVDECVLLYQRLPDAEQARHVSVDADNNVWVGGFPFEQRQFHKLDGATAAIIDSFDARVFGCGGYGGLIDGNGVLWSIGWGSGEGPLLRYDPATRTGSCVNTFGGYGLGIDTNGYVWASLWESGIAKVSPDGVLEPGFPKPTWLPPSTTAQAMSFAATDTSVFAPPPVGDLARRSMPEPAVMPTSLMALVAPDEAPDFSVAPDDDWVGSMSSWTPGTTVQMDIDDGTNVVFSDSQIVDPDGNFGFSLWMVFDVQRGHTVTVSDGVTTKDHVVLDLYVDGIDVDFNTVSGRAAPGTDVDVWVHDTDVSVTVTADGSGNWTADFSALTDLTYASNGGSQQTDDDGDTTGVSWAGPSFVVSPDDDWVGSMTRWTAGSTVALTIVGSAGSYADTRVVDPAGNFNFSLGGVFDLQRGDTVTVTDGTTTKVHVVLDLDVEAIDLDIDTVSGRATAGADVHVWVHQDDSSLTVTPDSSGNWTADFSVLTDLTATSDGNSQQLDHDGDATWDFWSLPSFTAAPDDDWVGALTRWTAGSTVALTIVGNAGSYADTQVVDPDGNFHFNLGGIFDVERGDTLTVSDGTTSKTHDVRGLFVDTIDVTADIISGRAAPDSDVDVWVHDTEANVTVTADGAGNWVADFSGSVDLTYASDGGSQQTDDDGDATGAFWASPSFVVSPSDNWIESSGRWMAEAPVIITVEDEFGTEVHREETTADPNGFFHIEWGGVFDLLRSHIVTVTDGATTKVHDLFDLYVDTIDVVGDTLAGRGPADTDVDVWVHDSEAQLTVTPDVDGNWIADFSGLVDLTHASNGGTQQTDLDGDATNVGWRLPRFTVDIDRAQIHGEGWSQNAEIMISVDDVPLEPVFSDPGGNFDINPDFDFAVGDLVTVVGPALTKTLLLTNPVVSELNAAADLVSGTAEPLAQLDVWAATNQWSEGNMRIVTADATGAWTADFSVPVEGWPPLDVTDTTSVTTYEWDDDRDATVRNFGPPVQANRGVAVTPVDNHVWVANSQVDSVTRLDNDGNVLAVIEVGSHPTGVAVDASGKVWVTNLGSDSAMRIDPTAGADGLGAIDLTVELGEGASPYNYSDMTGAVVVGSTSPQGFWAVVQDSGEAGFEWGRITWNTEPEAREPAGSEIVVEARTADSEAGLGGEAFVPVVDGQLFSSFGRFIEVRVTLKASPDNLSPVLSDIRIQPALIEVDVDIKPGSYPNSINLKRTTGVIPVAVLGGDDFDVSTIDVSTLRFGPGLALPAHDLTKIGKHIKDVDGDGYLDLISHYRIGETGLGVGDTEACLTGETVGGIPIEGCDSVRTFWPGGRITGARYR